MAEYLVDDCSLLKDKYVYVTNKNFICIIIPSYLLHSCLLCNNIYNVFKSSLYVINM